MATRTVEKTVDHFAARQIVLALLTRTVWFEVTPSADAVGATYTIKVKDADEAILVATCQQWQ